jgi:ankyrin repeat protein
MDVNAKARELFDESPWTSPELLAQERSIWLATGFTPLHLASWSGSEEVVRILLADPETDLDAVTMDGFTPLHMAADRGHEGVVHLLLEEHKNRKPERLMHYGLKFNSERDMRYMNPERDERMLKFKDLSKPTKGNGPTNVLDCAGRTPLHYASRQGRAMTVRELLEWNDTFVNAPDADGLLPMHMAAREGHVEVVELLLYEYHWAPIILKGLLETLDTKVGGLKDLTISEGLHLELLPRPDLSDTFTRITDGSTPLHLASVQGHSQVVLKLLKYLDIRAQNVKQETALDLVVKWLQENNWENCIKLIEVFKILLICMPRVISISDMDINFVKRLQLNSDLGRENLLWKLDALHASTLLHWAAATGSAYLVQLLLVQPGMDINAVAESEKFTPLHFAARSGHTDVVKLLTAQERLSLNEEDWLGRTALQIAAEKNEQLKWKGKKSPEALNPFAGIIEISWRDVEKLLLEQPDVMNYISFLYRDRQVFVDAANAILVGSALIATISYGGWITPPLGYISYYHTQVYTQCTNYSAII